MGMNTTAIAPTKQDLQARRATLIAEMDALGSGNGQALRRADIQGELARLKIELKAINIAEAAALKRSADARHASGLNRAHTNLARATAKQAHATQALVERDNFGPTRGEMIITRARQLVKLLDGIKPEHRAAHTVQFLPALHVFVDGQANLLRDEKRSAINVHHARFNQIELDNMRSSQAEPDPEPELETSLWSKTWEKGK